MSEFLWVEKYRPHTVADCILPDLLKKTFQEYVNTDSIPNLMLTGSAGVGKTTVAKAMCDEIGINHLYINASENRGIDMLRTTIRGYASTVSLTGGRKVIILDEADYLTPEAQAALDRKSTRLNSSHLGISYAVFCLKKKTIYTLRQN